jgi:prevent-host-death family protein
METIGAYEAKTHLPRLLERVARGERITITKHGVPVAVLQPPASQKKATPKQTIADLRKFRERNRLQGLSIREMIVEGRR